MHYKMPTIINYIQTWFQTDEIHKVLLCCQLERRIHLVPYEHHGHF